MDEPKFNNIPELAKAEIYTGSFISLKNLVINLGLEPHQYHFNVMNSHVVVYPLGATLRPGDYYHYRLPQEFKAIG